MFGEDTTAWQPPLAERGRGGGKETTAKTKKGKKGGKGKKKMGEETLMNATLHFDTQRSQKGGGGPMASSTQLAPPGTSTVQVYVRELILC